MHNQRILPEKISTMEEYLLYSKQVYVYNLAKSFISPDSICLDLGCGDGYGSKILSSVLKQVIGLDIDEKIVKRASKKYGQENLCFKSYKGETLPFPDNNFDAIVSFQVIEHIKDDLNFISEVYRILKPDGIFIITTPNKNLRLPKHEKPWNIYHVREYEPIELKKLLETKFKKVRLLGINANDKIQAIETKRIKRNLKVIAWDFLNLRRLLPKSISKFIIEILHLIRKYFYHDSDMLRLNIFDIYNLREDNVEKCLDVLGICIK